MNAGIEPFSLRFYRARRLAGASVKEAAERCGVTVPTVKSWETGAHAPGFDEMRGIEDAMKKAISYARYYPVIEKVRAATGVRITEFEALEIMELSVKTYRAELLRRVG